MRKNFGKHTWFYPMPVLIIGSYDENGNANAMTAAWGGVYDTNQVMLCLSRDHKTTRNIRAKGAFTVSFADAAHVAESDYLGIVSGNEVPDKLQRAGLHTEKSEFVDAPVISELPMTLECRLLKFNEDVNVIGEIVNISADERILGENGEIDPARLEPISFDGVHNIYLKSGEKAGTAFQDGKALQ